MTNSVKYSILRIPLPLNGNRYSLRNARWDKASNENSTETRVITLDSTKPRIIFSGGTEENNTFFNRNWIFVNVSINETNFANATFYLYNSSLDLINETNVTSDVNPKNLSVNFTNIANKNETYYYNVTARDKAGNINSTGTCPVSFNFSRASFFLFCISFT